jgi:hypothetical protein
MDVSKTRILLSQQQRIAVLIEELERERANWDTLYRSYSRSADVCRRISQKILCDQGASVLECHQLGADTRGGLDINHGEAADVNSFTPQHQVPTDRSDAGLIYPPVPSSSKLRKLDSK